MTNEWREITSADKDGAFFRLKLGDRVTCGKYEGGGWCSLDGGFTKNKPPTHCIPLPDIADWWELMRWERAHP